MTAGHDVMPSRTEGVAYLEWWPALAPDDDVTAVWARPGTGDEVADFGEIGEALDWSRSRAPVVLVRVDRARHSFRYHRFAGLWLRLFSPVELTQSWYSAGETSTAEHDARPWPNEARGAAQGRVAGYGGQAQVTVGDVSWAGVGGQVRATWESLRDEEMVALEQTTSEDLEAAVAWAKRRARFILFHSGPPDYQYFSAGEDIPGLELPSWPLRFPPEEPPGVTGTRSVVSRQGRTFAPDWDGGALRP